MPILPSLPAPRVLLVEDEIIIATDLQAILDRLGFHVLAVLADGDEAVQAALRLEPDLVLMDIVLQGQVDGIEAAHRIRSHKPIPVVFITAYADNQRLERAKLTMPFGYILKPFSERDLKITLDMALYTARVEAERRQTEEALRRSEALLDAFFEYSPAGLALLDKDLKYLRVNQALRRMNGPSLEAHLGRTVGEVLGPVASLVEPLARQVLDTGQPLVNAQVTVHDPQREGGQGCFFGSLFPVRDQAGDSLALGAVVLDVSSQYRSERDKRDAQALLTTVIDSLPFWYSVKDDQLKYHLINRRMAEDLEIEASQWQGRSADELPEPYPRLLARNPHWDQRILAGEPRVEVPEYTVQLDGRTTWRRMVKVPWKDDNGRIQGVITWSEDITEEKTVREAMVRSEAKYRQLFDMARDMVLLHDLEAPEGGSGRFIEVNPAAREALGYTLDEFRAMTPQQILDPKEWDLSPEEQRLLEKDQGPLIEKTLISKDGRRIPVELLARTFDLEGFPRVLTIGRDLRERRRLQTSLAEGWTHLRRFLDDLPALVLFVGADHVIRFANRFFQEEFGAREGMTCHQVFQASPHPCETCRTFEVFQTGRPVTWEWVDPKGRVFEFHDSPYADPNGTPLMLEFAFDVTAARRTKPADR